MTSQDAFLATFDALQQIMAPFERDLTLDTREQGDDSLTAPLSEIYRKGLWFGGVRIKKNDVSYHVMPVYVFPDLLEGMSGDLKKRMQGKSCFVFKRVVAPLLEELATLDKAGFERYRAEACA